LNKKFKSKNILLNNLVFIEHFKIVSLVKISIKMNKIFSLLLVFFSFTTFSQIHISNNDMADIATIISELDEKNGRVTEKLKFRYAINTINGVDYLSLLAKVTPNFNSNTAEQNGIIVGARINDIVSLKFPINNLDEIYAMSGIHTLQVAGKVKPDLNKVLWDIRADSVHAGLNLPQSYTGNDVLIGITDWGFDYSHPMFYDTLLQNTRILAAWDHYKTSGPAPNGFNYGTEFSTEADLIAAGSDTSNIYSYHYHASHVAGICGGSGAGTSYRGVGFEAQFLFTTFLVDEASVIDAWQWMYNKSITEGKRLVINMSWGLYHTGALDGTSLLSQALDGFTDLGVLFVTSGGNNGNDDFHIKKDFSNDTLLTNISFYSSATLTNLWGQSIHAWGDAGNEFTARIQVLNGSNQIMNESPWFSTLTTTTYVDSFVVFNGVNDTIRYNLSMDDAYPTNGRPQMRFRIKKPIGYKVVLKSYAPSGTVHFWNVTELVTDVGNWGMPFTSIGANYTAGDANYGIGSPACSNSAITVAAYGSQTNTNGGSFVGGNIASFSSIGPLINSNMKPDISAPGVSVGSSISSYTDAGFNQTTSVNFNGRTYPFARLSGTSMSSPVVAGVVSLIWEANPYLSPWQIKEIIRMTAREDIRTGDLPDEGDFNWGHGKINAYAAVQMATNTVGVNEITKELMWTIYPNPANQFLTIKGIEGGVKIIQIIDLNGRICGEYLNTLPIDINYFVPGIYILRIVKDNRVQQQKFIISK
jgi:minor extracellular serine protease Vpr